VLAKSDRALVLQKGLAVMQGKSEDIANDPALTSFLGL
jgi:branched-chain amino acid transport system ATP-binding protein